MQKIIKAQATITKDDRMTQIQTKVIVELNPYHPFIKELLERIKSGPDQDTEEYTKILFEMSLL